MIGYVFIRSGALETSRPELYPSRQDQIENLRSAFDALGEKDGRICVEKVSNVTGLKSLPKLSVRLFRAAKTDDRVFIDDFRRLFLACPIDLRWNLIEELARVGPIFWELQGDWRPFASLKRDDLLELYGVRSRVVFRLEPKATAKPFAALLRQQTARARTASAKVRAKTADDAATRLIALRDEIIATHPTATLKDIASEVTRRGLKTSRGNPWTASSVHRALKRSGL